jgi:hypothetical protein
MIPVVSFKYFFVDTFSFIMHKEASFIASQALTNL